MKVCLVGSSGGHLTHLYMLKPFWENKDRFWVTFDAEYKKLAGAEEKVIFGGRLGEYKYYDMDAVIASALDMCEKELQ